MDTRHKQFRMFLNKKHAKDMDYKYYNLYEELLIINRPTAVGR